MAQCVAGCGAVSPGVALFDSARQFCLPLPCAWLPSCRLFIALACVHALPQVLEGAALVYFDGRLTEAAVVLAAAARAAGVPVLVEAERLRPGGCGL